MKDERMPYEFINDRDVSDAEVLAELKAIPPLADEDDPCWASDDYWHKVADRFLALWDIAAERRIRSAIPLMLERACFGDPGEIMRNLCHALEAIVTPNWTELTEPCVTALRSPRAGTRLWAAHELMRLRDPLALLALEQAANDKVKWVSDQVQAALETTRGELKKGCG